VSQPKLKSASVVLKYLAASGFRAEWTAKSGADCPRPQTANQILIHASREIARVGAIAGCADEIAAAVAEAIQAVREKAELSQ
jgi:hypothetical protein